MTGIVPQPTLPDVAISDKELLRAKSKSGSRKESIKEWDEGVYPGREWGFLQGLYLSL